MERKLIEAFLKDMSYNTKYTFFETAKDKDSLSEIAEKRGVTLSDDISIFKSVYALTDFTNHNGCTLPTEEVEKSLHTIIGKPVNLNHVAKRVVGHFIDAKLEGNQIISWGVIYKRCFPEDYEILKELMSTGQLGISFEAYGSREFTNAAETEYNLMNILFAGGGILPDENPAFDDAEVLEMSKLDRAKVLEFASKMDKSTPKEFFKITDKIENSDYNIWDIDAIMRVVNEQRVPNGEDESIQEILSIDFKNQKINVSYWPTGSIGEIDLKPYVDLIKKGKGTWENPKDELKSSKAVKAKIEKSTYTDYEFDYIVRAVGEVAWLDDEDGWREITNIDFKNNKVILTYQPSGTEVSIDLTPQSEVIKKGKAVVAKLEKSFLDKFQEFDGNFDELESFVQTEIDYMDTNVPEIAQLSLKDRTKLNDSDFAVIKKIKNVNSGKRRKVRMLPLNDATHVRIALAHLEQDNVKDTFKTLGISLDNVIQRILNKAKELKMEDLLKKYEQATVEEQTTLYSDLVKEVASLKGKVQELTDVQEAAKVEADKVLAEKDSTIAEAQAKVEEVSKEAEDAKTEIARRDGEIQEAEIAKRKEQLGDIAEGMEDSDILDDVKYELALLKKENAELKAAAKIDSPAEGEVEPELAKGSKGKGSDDELLAMQKRVLKRAYGGE